jgi:molybdate transport system substrate-binding protein
MLTPSQALADEIHVMASVAFKAPYLSRVAQFERMGHTVKTTWLPTVEIVKKIQNEEAWDLVILDAKAIDRLTLEGKLEPGSKVPYVSSGIGIGVAKGAPKPVLNNEEDLRQLLLATPSLAYSTGPSGAYLGELFKRMGVAQAISGKTKVVQGEPVGNLIKRGEAALAFQQIPEILAVPEIDFAGALPSDVQYVTQFAFARPVKAQSAADVHRLIRFLKSDEAAQDMRAHGLEPLAD